MNVLADEGVDSQIVERLRLDGHDVLYVAEMEPSLADEMVLQRANQHSALLLTEDKDFGELVYRQQLVHLGVVLLRIMGLTSAAKATIVAKVFEEHGEELPRSFTVISPGVLRIRKVQS